MSDKKHPVVISDRSAEKDEDGQEYLAEEKWEKMGTDTQKSKASEYFDKMLSKISGGLEGEDFIRVCWLSMTLFFIVGGYWLLRSLKDPIMSVMNGVEYIPQAKIVSLFVVLGLVVVYNKMLDLYPKHQVFYMMGGVYGILFGVMGFMLMHPIYGLPNTNADPSRLLGWISYCTIESFGSMVVQCYWALVNSSVDVTFAKKNFGLIVAGAQIGSILGPTMATQADKVGIPALYLSGSAIMFFMVVAMYYYVQRFGVPAEEKKEPEPSSSGAAGGETKKEKGGMMEGFYLFYDHDYVKGIFAVSSLYMVQVTVVDYMMKVLAKERYSQMYPDDPEAAVRAFASFMGYFGQTTNSISFLFSLFGTSFIIKRFGLTKTLISFPVLMLICTVFVWIWPNIWVVFGVMMVMKGMSYALNNPTKEILYQMTSTTIKFKCKSWIDTFGQRSAKAGGSLITNAFASSIADLTLYGSLFGVAISVLMIWISDWMGKAFEELSAKGEKVGEMTAAQHAALAAAQAEEEDNTCGQDEEGQGSESGSQNGDNNNNNNAVEMATKSKGGKGKGKGNKK